MVSRIYVRNFLYGIYGNERIKAEQMLVCLESNLCHWLYNANALTTRSRKLASCVGDMGLNRPQRLTNLQPISIDSFVGGGGGGGGVRNFY